jgi:DNA-binding response OmpR family regulator
LFLLAEPPIPPSIILVEDDPPLRTLTARALQEHGYRVRPVATAAEMWTAFDASPVDLVILDIMLPGTSGIDLCRMLRERARADHLHLGQGQRDRSRDRARAGRRRLSPSRSARAS